MAQMSGMVLLGMIVFAAASFFFALAESALFSLGRWKTQRLAESAAESAQQVADLLKEPQDLLATIVLGNSLANAGIVATALWAGLSGHWPLGVAIATALILVLIGGEVVPKTLAVRAPEVWSLRLVRAMVVLRNLTGPLRRLVQHLDTFILRWIVPKNWKPQTTFTDEEYQELLEMAFQQGALAQSEKEIILQIVSLDRRTAKDVMRPRSQMAGISDDLSIDEMIAAARRFRHRRLPVYDETPDTIVGILNTRTLLLDPDAGLENAIEFPSFVPESMNLLQLLKSFQRQQRGLAIVLDEFGGTAGIVTAGDILEDVIGKIGSDTDTGFVMEKLAEGRWRVSGAMRLDDFRRVYPDLGTFSDVETMAGLMIYHMGVVPAPGESIVAGGLRLTATQVEERRIRELLVENVKRRGG